ncbi:SRPBCC family protein [Oscillatoria amoena NRMC-F 0135]|nr:SRPBCC family protein [Oscillatoria amoena NRMC-F 0135]
MTIVIIIVAIIALPFVLALFTKKSYSIERSILINRPVNVVFDYLKHIKNQDQFSKWVQMDPNMKKEYRGADGTVGFVYAWNGNKQAGEGEQEIKGIVENRKLDIEVTFIRPFAAVAKTPFTTEAVEVNETRVTWGMSSAMNYPMNIMLLFMNMEKLLGKDLEFSLQQLKDKLENQ